MTQLSAVDTAALLRLRDAMRRVTALHAGAAREPRSRPQAPDAARREPPAATALAPRRR